MSVGSFNTLAAAPVPTLLYAGAAMTGFAAASSLVPGAPAVAEQLTHVAPNLAVNVERAAALATRPNVGLGIALAVSTVALAGAATYLLFD